MINLIDQYYKIYFENQQDTQLEKFRKDNQLQPYRIRQLFFEIFKNSRIDFADMTTLSKDLRKKLSDNFEILSLKPEKIVDSSDTTKIAFRTKDGYIVESVIMYHKQGDS
jgi:23S rRNA (adenine2503-C2)-methyltransferase